MDNFDDALAEDLDTAGSSSKYDIVTTEGRRNGVTRLDFDCEGN